MSQQVLPVSKLHSGDGGNPAVKENAQTRKLEISTLDETHRGLLARAISRVASTELAEVTYAQLIDGLPLSDVAGDKGYTDFPYDHPIFEFHENLCPGIMDKTRKFRDEFRLETLRFDAKVHCNSLFLWSPL